MNGVKMNYWIETYTGKHIDPLHLEYEDIDITDIAHALSLICRFTGHCKRFYSVGQHSIYVAVQVGKMLNERNLLDMYDCTILTALLHDSAEAYLCDLARPVKQQLGNYQELENKILGMILKHFGIVSAHWEVIYKADELLMSTEANQLMYSKGLDWSCKYPPLPYKLAELSCIEVERNYSKMFQRLHNNITMSKCTTECGKR